jgi:hypothetical protein
MLHPTSEPAGYLDEGATVASSPTAELRVVRGRAEAGNSLLLLPATLDAYARDFFEEPHEIYLGENDVEGALSSVRLCVVRSVPHRGVHEALHFDNGQIRRERVLRAQADGGRWLAQTAPGVAWRAAPEAAGLRCGLLGLERRLGCKRALVVGVVCGAEGQRSEEEMCGNGEEALDEELRAALGETVHEGWPHWGASQLGDLKSGAAL